MNISRRTALLGGAGALLLAAPIARSGLVEHGLGIIRKHFGATIAASDAARKFTKDWAARSPERMAPRVGVPRYGEPGFLAHSAAEVVEIYADYGFAAAGVVGAINMPLEDSLIRDFLMSTNAYKAHKDGEELVYIAFADAYEAPCVNCLSSNFA